MVNEVQNRSSLTFVAIVASYGHPLPSSTVVRAPRRRYTLSNAIAMPMPPLTHSVARPRVAFRRSIS